MSMTGKDISTICICIRWAIYVAITLKAPSHKPNLPKIRQVLRRGHARMRRCQSEGSQDAIVKKKACERTNGRYGKAPTGSRIVYGAYVMEVWRGRVIHACVWRWWVGRSNKDKKGKDKDKDKTKWVGNWLGREGYKGQIYSQHLGSYGNITKTHTHTLSLSLSLSLSLFVCLFVRAFGAR